MPNPRPTPRSSRCLSHHSMDEVQEHMTKEVGDEAPSTDTVCRICYDRAVSSDNPLISLCRCTGSLRYTHYECFKAWMNSKIVEKKNDTYTYISFKNLKCEICKQDFPSSLRVSQTASSTRTRPTT